MIRKATLGHITVTPGTLPEILAVVKESVRDGKQFNCIPINVTKYGLSKRNPRLCQAINAAELVVADGMPIRWFAKLLGLTRVNRITGIEFAESVIGAAAANSWRVYFFGASQACLEGAVRYHSDRHPRLNVVGQRNGFYSPEDAAQIVDEINATKPDVVLFGLGLPQKEFFIADNADRLTSRINIAVGGAFDVWSGTKKRAPKFIQAFGLEWLYRSFSNYKKATMLTRNASIFLTDMSVALFQRRRQNSA